MPPENGQYMVSAYVIVGAIYLLYTISLIRRARKEQR